MGVDLIATGAGTINTTGLTNTGPGAYTAVLNASQGAVSVGAQVDSNLYINAFAGHSAFGSGGLTYGNGTGDTGGIYGNAGYLLLPVGYVSGSALSGTRTYSNQTFASAGLNTGSYVYNLTNGARVTVNVGVNSAVPEPATWGLMLVGMGMVGGTLRSRRARFARAAA